MVIFLKGFIVIMVAVATLVGLLTYWLPSTKPELKHISPSRLAELDIEGGNSAKPVTFDLIGTFDGCKLYRLNDWYVYYFLRCPNESVNIQALGKNRKSPVHPMSTFTTSEHSHYLRKEITQ